MSRIFRNISAHVIACAAMCWLSSCSGASSGSAEAEHHHDHDHEGTEVHISRAQTDIVGISFDTPTYAEIATTLRCTGRLDVDPQCDASVTPVMPGVVKRIMVTAGQHVSAGQPIAQLENPEAISLQQQYLQAVDRLNLARTELERQQALAAQGAGIARNLQAAVTERDIAATEVSGLKARLEMSGINAEAVTPGSLLKFITVVSPIAGTVSEVTARVGAYADATTPMMTILNPSGLYCVATVYEKDLQLVSPGESAIVSPVNTPSVEVEGKIQLVNPVVDRATKAVQVRINLLQADSRLLPGMAVTVQLRTGRQRALTLPSDAIFTEGSHKYVFIVEGEEDDELIVEKMEVNTGVTASGLTALLPMADGTMPVDTLTRVVTQGAFYISSMLSDHGEHNH